MTFGVEKGVPKSGSKKGCPPESNQELFPDWEPPGAAASCARYSDKKQLFEQQLKHCSKFLLKKVVWAQNSCRKGCSELKFGVRKLTGLNERIAETCRLLKVAANVGVIKSVQTIVEVSNPFPFVVSGSRAQVLPRPGLRPGELKFRILFHLLFQVRGSESRF